MIVDINKLEGWLKEKGYKYKKTISTIVIGIENSYFHIFINTENRKDFKLDKFNKKKGAANVNFFYEEPEETVDYINKTLPEYLLKILYELQEIKLDVDKNEENEMEQYCGACEIIFTEKDEPKLINGIMMCKRCYEKIETNKQDKNENNPVCLKTKYDNIKKPFHYNTGKIETIEIIKEITKDYKGFHGHLVGTAVKYLSRAPYKNNYVEDLNKAYEYLGMLIKEINDDK